MDISAVDPDPDPARVAPPSDVGSGIARGRPILGAPPSNAAREADGEEAPLLEVQLISDLLGVAIQAEADGAHAETSKRRRPATAKGL
jgi:hypothetical protein